MLRARSAALGAALCVACAGGGAHRHAYYPQVSPDPPLPVTSPPGEDSLWGPPEAASQGDGIADDRRASLDSLIRRFVPTLVLPLRDDVRRNGRRYRMQPSDAALFADTLRIDRFSTAPPGFVDAQDIVLADLSDDSLMGLVHAGMYRGAHPHFQTMWYFDFPGRNAREWWRAYADVRSGADSAQWAEPVVYGHPFLRPDGRVVVQYWWFYPLNDFIGNHEGDWEHVNVVPTADLQTVEEVHYYFHQRSIRLPDGRHEPELTDGTHPVVYVGGRMYFALDYPIRWLAGERNEGSHGSYPYAGEWEGAAGAGHTESVARPSRDSTRVIPWNRFTVKLLPEPERVDYHRHPAVMREWAWLLLPVRWGYPEAPSLGWELKAVNLGNRAPLGPAFNAGWHRTAPGVSYPVYTVRRVHPARALVEDLLQPWYYLYLFRRPRFVHDTRDPAMTRRELQRIGLAPRGGLAERGLGTTLLGVATADPVGAFAPDYRPTVSVSLMRSLWAKARAGVVEFTGGFQRFSTRADSAPGSLTVAPLLAGVVLATPDALFRLYGTGGAGVYSWRSRATIPGARGRIQASGWSVGWSAGAGLEYYLRANVAFDLSVRYHRTRAPIDPTGLSDHSLRFVSVWAGHYLRF